MDDYLACSDFCEENGFDREAEILRSLAGGGRKAYVVVHRGAEYNDEIMSPQEQGAPRTLFLDRAAAERSALDLEAEWHRNHNILDYCYSLDKVTRLKANKLEAAISAILGREYRLPNNGRPTFDYSSDPLVTVPATDDQMRRISELFTLKFHYVVETEFASTDRRAPEPPEE